MIRLEPIDPLLLTSYGARGSTRNAHGRRLPEGSLLTVGQAAAAGRDPWRATPTTAADLVLLDAAWQQATGRRLRLTEAWRSPRDSQAGHQRHKAWITAGRPPIGSSAYDARSMKAAWVAPPYRSMHNCGMAVDLDVSAMCDDDDDLGRLWALAARHGFTPIISEPHLLQSEAWHFDHTAVLGAARRVFDEHLPRHERYGETASVGCALTGLHPGLEHYVQARLTMHGVWCGRIDGVIGPLTRAALRSVGVDVQGRPHASQHVAALDELGVGIDAMTLA